MDLKKDLDEYLLLQSDQKKSFKVTLPNISLQKPSGWFNRAQQEQDESRSCFPTLSRLQRIMGFLICIGMGILCFSISMFYIPVLLLKARKFSLLFTLGSAFIYLSFMFLWGPTAYLKHFFSKERWLLSTAYVATLVATLYCALHLQSTPFTVFAAVGQVIVLLWIVLGNVPGGASGLALFTKLFSFGSKVGPTLPI